MSRSLLGKPPGDLQLPHPVRPLPDESLLGFVARLDIENDLPLGTVRAAAATTPAPMTQVAAYASGSGLDLRELGALSGNTVEALEAMTFMPDLRRLTRQAGVSIRTLGLFRLRVCPACWRSKPLHRRQQLLPGVETCLEHGIAIGKDCVCGEPLRLSNRAFGSCLSCGTSWADLPNEPADPVILERDLLIAAIYERLLALDRPLRRTSTRSLRRRVTSARRHGKSVPIPDLRTVSVQRLVAISIALSGDPDLVAQLLELEPDPCPNLACSRYSSDPWSYADVERHCPVCGSRFVGLRLLTCFDLDHGQSRPTVTQIRRARRRLGRWRRDLRRTCAGLADAGEPVSVTKAFRLAGVPMNANLRASRLGLTAIVRAAEAKRKRSTAPWQFVLRGCVRQAATRRDFPWLTEFVRTELGSYLPMELMPPPPRGPWIRRWNAFEIE